MYFVSHGIYSDLKQQKNVRVGVGIEGGEGGGEGGGGGVRVGVGVCRKESCGTARACQKKNKFRDRGTAVVGAVACEFAQSL